MKTNTQKECRTCLYMATHEKCNGCLETPKDFVYKGDGKFPPYTYHHYKEGNWMDRVIQAEIDGKQNIVIGGQGEAEVNTKWTPQKTSDHLHYVSEQCGYVTGHLHFNKDDTKIGLKIYTSEGQFRLVWSGTGISHSPCRLLYIENLQDTKGWCWSNKNPFRKAS